MDWVSYVNEFPKLTIQDMDVYRLPGGKGETVYIGDSNMEQYWPRLVKVSKDNQSSVNSASLFVGGGCFPALEIERDSERAHCNSVMSNALRYVQLVKPDAVVLAAQWTSYVGSAQDGNHHVAASRGSLLNEHDAAEFTKYVSELAHHAKKIYIIKNIPVSEKFSARRLLNRFDGAAVLESMSRSEFESKHRKAFSAIHELTKSINVTFIEPMDYLCKGDDCPGFVGSTPIYMDASHLTNTYVKYNAKYIDETMFRR